MEKIQLNVFAITGDTFCVSADDGEKVFKQIRLALDAGKKVELSFLNIEMLTSAFLNTAIGQLYGIEDENKIKSNLSVTEISDDDKLLIKRVADTAREYYKDPDRFEKSIKKIMEDEG